jgi:hypothetical protein
MNDALNHKKRVQERHQTTKTTFSKTSNPEGMGLAIQDTHPKPHDGTVDPKPSLKRRKVGQIFR